MATRSDLQSLLEQTLGSAHVYFQPPETVKMEYPAIVYHLDDIDPRAADNGKYTLIPRYSLTLISRDPDDPVIMKLAKLQMCEFDRYYSADNLHHFAYSIYY